MNQADRHPDHDKPTERLRWRAWPLLASRSTSQRDN